MARTSVMRVVTGLIWGYFLITLLSFVTGAMVCATGLWPSHWRVPWSGVNSVVETRDGTIFVIVSLWGRIEQYDRSGRFLGSWKQPFDKGGAALATDEDGRIYLRHQRDVFLLSPQGELAKKYTATAYIPRTWRLSQTGEPNYAFEATRLLVRRIVRRGEVLFSEDNSRYFVSPDGTVLQSALNSITRLAASGQPLFTYRSPWYFAPLLFPFPGLLGFVGALILILVRRGKEHRRRRRAARPQSGNTTHCQSVSRAFRSKIQIGAQTILGWSATRK
jgi:hypothetical protein